MSLKDTSKHLKNLLQEVSSDLDRAENGNKAASQRVRTGTIKLEKLAKVYRKESIKAEKSGNFKKKKSSDKPKASAKKAPAKKAATKTPTARPAASKQQTASKKGGKAKKGKR